MKKYIIITGIILILVIAGIFASKSFTGKAVAQSDVKEFNLKATRFQYSPDTITVNLGDKVKINIDNVDTQHGIRIPEFNVKDVNSVEFTADKKGEFDFFCTVYCGDSHKEMKGKLIVK